MRHVWTISGISYLSVTFVISVIKAIFSKVPFQHFCNQLYLLSVAKIQFFGIRAILVVSTILDISANLATSDILSTADISESLIKAEIPTNIDI